MRWLERSLKDSPHVRAVGAAHNASRERNFKSFLERSAIHERSARGGREECIEEYEESLSFLSIIPSPQDLRAANPSRFLSAAGGREPDSGENRALGPGRMVPSPPCFFLRPAGTLANPDRVCLRCPVSRAGPRTWRVWGQRRRPGAARWYAGSSPPPVRNGPRLWRPGAAEGRRDGRRRTDAPPADKEVVR